MRVCVDGCREARQDFCRRDNRDHGSSPVGGEGVFLRVCLTLGRGWGGRSEGRQARARSYETRIYLTFLRGPWLAPVLNLGSYHT